MTFDIKNLTPAQKTTLDAELATRGVKFLPGQAVRRLLDPQAKTLKVLGSVRRQKAKRALNREAALKQQAQQAAGAKK